MPTSNKSSHLDAYEQAALREIHRYKHPQPSLFRRTLGYLAKPADWAVEAALRGLDLVGLRVLVERVFTGFMDLVGDAATFTVSQNLIFGVIRMDTGKSCESLEDVLGLELCDCDRAITGLLIKYPALAGAEGFACGMLGLAGIPADVTALIALNLRAISETATFYGFDSTLEYERAFALSVLGFGASGSGPGEVAVKRRLAAQCAKIARLSAQRETSGALQQQLLEQVAQAVFDVVGDRLTRQKLAEILPVAGAVVGAGVNVHMTSRVCRAAYMLYRERHLAAKYGAEVISE